MAEYNPSKIIKDGNTYNFRDTTKIPLAGSNEISGSLIPSTDGTVNLGSSSYQWDQAYIKSLTINGVACGDILTHNANEFVDVSTAQTINGPKTFSGNTKFTSTATIEKSTGDVELLIKNTVIDSTSVSANAVDDIRFTDSSDRITGSMRISYDTSNGVTAMVYARSYSADGNTSAIAGLSITSNQQTGAARASLSANLLPNSTNTYNLGSPSLQWNNTYTRNILIDNDINIASSLINKTSTSGVISIRGGLNTQDGASIGLYGKDYNGGIAGNIYMTAYGNSDYTNFRIYPNGTISVYNNSTNTTKNVAMQEDTVNLTGAQTIGGIKTFSSNIIIQGNKKVTCNLDNSFIELDGGTTWGKGGSIVLSGQDRSSYTNSVLIVSKSDTNTDILQYQNGELKPLSNNTNNSSLGTSTNKWKSFNGVEPSGLSLPSDTSINIDTTDFTWGRNFTFTPSVNGHLFINIAGSTGTRRLSLKTGRGEYYFSNQTDILRFTMPVYKGKLVTILATSTIAETVVPSLTLFPCQGNV